MIHTSNDVHQQFASFFKSPFIQPYAYLLSKRLSEGHICLRLDELDPAKEELPASFQALLHKKGGWENERLVGLNPGDRKPFILFNNCLYLQRYFHYESVILKRIKEFLEMEEKLLTSRYAWLTAHRGFIRELFPFAPEGQGPDWQFVAAVSAVLNNFTIITGGPGTGKTTTVARILAVLYQMNPQQRVALAAPTGKAALRMAESLKNASLPVNQAIKDRFSGLEPSTIHRLLRYTPDSPYFFHNEERPLNYEVVIVDESSMIDTALFAKLLGAVGPETRLILLGDKDQLASVEAGSLFGDLCQAQPVLNIFSPARAACINALIDDPQYAIPNTYISDACGHPLFQHVIELRYSHRFKNDAGIGRFSRAVIGGNSSELVKFLSDHNDEEIISDPGYSPELFENFAYGYADFIEEKDIASALKKLNTLRVLCAVREGDQGLYAVNRRIEKFLEREKLIRLSGEFYENRPVIVTGNNYSVGVFNGDIGIVRPDNRGNMKVWFENAEEKIIPVLPASLGKVETVFAMTIHKSQGSEFNQVMIVLPQEKDIAVLTRELLYTAVTRARHQVVLQGTTEVITATVKTNVKRASGLSARFLL